MIKLLLTTLIIVTCFACFYWAKWFWRFRSASTKESNKGTLYDVRILIQQGDDEMAVLLYCNLYKCSHNEGQARVAELKRSIEAS
ncbi:MAG: hypothetical protein ACI9F2_001186 [Lysobacterales bacterium]|jgi:hypothetical protein